MKNKKGFTLIELLAVIVILAIIALIAVPIVLNMIDSARKSAAKSSALGYIDAIEYNNGFAEAEQVGYTKIADGVDIDVATITGLKIKGKLPSSGKVTIENGRVVSATDLCIEGYKVSYQNKDITSVVRGCSGSGSTQKVWNITTDVNNNNEADIGDVICISNECFYVISNNGTNIKALAKYNLLVGRNYTDQYTSTAIDNESGIQDATAIGWHSNWDSSSPNVATTHLTESYYWGNNSTVDVTNSECSIKTYLTNYKNHLTTLGYTPQEVTIITKEEIESLIFDNIKQVGKTTLSYENIAPLVPAWIYTSSYWTRSTESSATNRVYAVKSDGNFEHTYCTADAGTSNLFGVRPVLTIFNSDI